MYECCVPLNVACSPRYHVVMAMIARMGEGYTGPSYHALRTTLLEDIKKECKLAIENLRSHWNVTGCTIMADGWTDKRHRSLINFLVYYPAGTCFVR